MSTSRRTVLIAGLLGSGFVLQGCASDDVASGTPSPSSDPDTAVRQQAAQAEADLIAAYDEAITMSNDPLLLTIRAEHQAHLQALGASGITATTPTAITAADLRGLEKEAARGCRTFCAQASDPELIRTLTFIGASEAAHVPALGGSA